MRLFFLLGTLALLAGTAVAQTGSGTGVLAAAPAAGDDTPRFEIGVQFTSLTNRELDPTRTSTDTLSFPRETLNGGGGRFTVNLTEHVAVEVEANSLGGSNLTYQAVAGVKAGIRGDRFGLFAKARPGFVHYLRVGSRTEYYPSRNAFAFDLGGVAEFYPMRSVVVRLDVGDTMIRVPGRPGFGFVGVPYESEYGFVDIPAETSHNLQVGVGVGFRF